MDGQAELKNSLSLLLTLKWDVKGVVEFQGSPNEEDRLKAVALAKELAKSVKEWTN